jgi:hypothetical protein
VGRCIRGDAEVSGGRAPESLADTLFSAAFCLRCPSDTRWNDVPGLWAFRTFFDLELHLFAFFQTLVPLSLNIAEVDEYIWAALSSDKAISLSFVEPPSDLTLRWWWRNLLDLVADLALVPKWSHRADNSPGFF